MNIYKKMFDWSRIFLRSPKKKKRVILTVQTTVGVIQFFCGYKMGEDVILEAKRNW